MKLVLAYENLQKQDLFDKMGTVLGLTIWPLILQLAFEQFHQKEIWWCAFNTLMGVLIPCATIYGLLRVKSDSVSFDGLYPKSSTSLKHCICGGEAIIEHEKNQYFACCVECTCQTKETFVEPSDAETAWNNGETEKLY